MTNHEMLNMLKAARAGLSFYASPDEWHRAIVAVSEANREQGESVEMAEARLTKSDETVRQFDKMRREALADADRERIEKRGRPRTYSPAPVSITKAERSLFELAKRHAQTHSTTFEQAFVAVIDTPEGGQLYRETRRPLR